MLLNRRTDWEIFDARDYVGSSVWGQGSQMARYAYTWPKSRRGQRLQHFPGGQLESPLQPKITTDESISTGLSEGLKLVK